MKRIILQSILFFIVICSYGQSHRLAVLDICDRNLETNKENLASALHMAEVAGMPYLLTTSLEEAQKYPFILLSSSLRDETFSLSEIQSLSDYVSAGGILIAPFIKSTNYFELFGINGTNRASTRYWLNWDVIGNHPELEWVNEDLETQLPLADAGYYRSIYTRAYSIDQASVLANFEDNSAAITVNNYGNGKAYALGFELKDVVLRHLLNKDYKAEHTYCNGHDPTTTLFIIFLRDT